MYPVETINYWLSLGTIAMQVAGVVLLIVYFLRKRFPDLEDIARMLGTWGLALAFLTTLAGSALTLFYSEILGIAPCSLCWLQRVFLYPQVVLFALAIWKKDSRAADYSIALSLLGFVVALYQHYLQMGGTSLVPCPATADKAVDCSVRFLFEFNYITFPLMAATLFAFLIVLMLFVRRTSR